MSKINNKDDFIFRVVKQKGKLDLHTSRQLQPMEIMEITANVLKLIPDEMRQMVVDVATNAIENKNRVLVS